ncbi:MAG: Fic family protein [Opitutales bacterium]|jgi:Fic family protein
MIKYSIPDNWIKYDRLAVLQHLVNAKAAVIALSNMPSQRSWAEKMQVVQLKREIAGTSRIEGADFTERELDAAMQETPEQLSTRSQRQAAAAVATYRWIAKLPDDYPISEALIYEVHQRIVTGADDDHCTPGELRPRDVNVNFGIPPHRGAEGGEECAVAFIKLLQAVNSAFREHDPLIQALALHYHFASMHPFLDGNGRAARALEALLLQRTGLRDTLFIAMSNYYYEEKNQYLGTLASTRAASHDLTPFLLFGLKGIELQCQRLLKEIRTNVQKSLFRNVMYDLFNRLETPRKRVMAKRHLEILKLLLDCDSLSVFDILKATKSSYDNLQNPLKICTRDLIYLLNLGAIDFKARQDQASMISIRLEWATEITDTEFFRRVKKMPHSKMHSFLS